MFLLISAALAHACDQSIFSQIATPVPDDDGHGVATGTATFDGKGVVGGNFSIYSPYSAEAWQKVLLDAENQDVWVPEKFGYRKSNRIDRDHFYLAFDLAFLFDAVHVQRQLVVQVQNDQKGDAVRSCWWMVDPTPFKSTIDGKGWTSDAEWERAMMGRWTVTPQADGRSLVSYQWWTEEGKVPSPILRYAVGRTLPELLDAFNERVRQVAGK